jgi:hypothetical protein
MQENILLASVESDTHIKLSDFGLVKIFEDAKKQEFNKTKLRSQRTYTRCGYE